MDGFGDVDSDACVFVGARDDTGFVHHRFFFLQDEMAVQEVQLNII